MEREEALAIVRPLVAGPRDANGELSPEFAALLDADFFHRRAFFVGTAPKLRGRADRIHQHLRSVPGDDPNLGSGRRPNQKALPAVIARKAATLSAIALIQNVLLQIRDNEDAEIRRLTCLASADNSAPATSCFVLGPNSITCSINIANGREIEKARNSLGVKRIAASKDVFGKNSHDVFRYLEDGEKGRPIAVSDIVVGLVTDYFARHGIEDTEFFTQDASQFRDALWPGRGNRLHMF